MEIILHRKNTINELNEASDEYGIEIDLRSQNNKLVIHHDPFSKNPEDFDLWLKNYRHGTLIINIKEEGLEDKIIYSLNKNNIGNYFFLDQSFPFFITKNKLVKRKTALRFSEYESIETIIKSASYANWIWIDCFNFYPEIDSSITLHLKNEKKLKTCLVSPELQGHNLTEFVEKNKELIKKYKPDAVCTKYPAFWKKF